MFLQLEWHAAGASASGTPATPSLGGCFILVMAAGATSGVVTVTYLFSAEQSGHPEIVS